MLKIRKLYKAEQTGDNEPEQMKLDDARRVKVLSPAMMVFKRFIRNKLAIVGFCILLTMFLFAFVGPLFSPYKIDQKFTTVSEESKNYAQAQYNMMPRIIRAEGQSLPSGFESAYLYEMGQHHRDESGNYAVELGEEIHFLVNNMTYTAVIIDPDPVGPTAAFYMSTDVAKSVRGTVEAIEGSSADADMIAAIQAFVDSNSSDIEFEYGDKVILVHVINRMETVFSVQDAEPFAISTNKIYYALRGTTSALQANPDFYAAVNVAVLNGNESFELEGATYTLTKGDADGDYMITDPNGNDLFEVTRAFQYGQVQTTQTGADGTEETVLVDFAGTVEDISGFAPAFNEAYAAAVAEAEALDETFEATFEFEGGVYTIMIVDSEPAVYNEAGDNVAVVINNFDPLETKYDYLHTDIAFVSIVEDAIANETESFEYDGETYTLAIDGDDTRIINQDGNEAVLVSNITMGAAENGVELTTDFTLATIAAVRTGVDGYKYTFIDQYGDEREAQINIVNQNYYVLCSKPTQLLLVRNAPDSEHLLGTDIYGMDVITRLMYGGRISLIVGFIVIFFELIIGVMVGGFSGYFGGWVDTILMRVVDLFNSLPFYPIVIILGAFMDEANFDGWTRIMFLMAVIGILGWTGIARVVRGQILSLREQDFMVATEATGIRTTRRVFRHLVPNVMPLLIVNATMGLGGIILTEATLGFLGLGVKYPMASWGSIINQATDMHVMNTAWWIWIPAGFLILITVLGFNFVGDGLRDAFDPKMKR
ncbi:MAG: ABC transporter permease [Clostridia bacterium]|nr:ABC transporter permease [Clostridia bacterium]